MITCLCFNTCPCFDILPVFWYPARVLISCPCFDNLPVFWYPTCILYSVWILICWLCFDILPVFWYSPCVLISCLCFDTLLVFKIEAGNVPLPQSEVATWYKDGIYHGLSSSNSVIIIKPEIFFMRQLKTCDSNILCWLKYS